MLEKIIESWTSRLDYVRASRGSHMPEIIFKMKNPWNAGILTITNRSASNSECGPICDLKTVTEVSKNGGFYPTTSIRLTKSHNPSSRPISGNNSATSVGQYCQSTGYRDKVLELYVRLFRGAVGPDFIFLDDNAPCHRAVLIDGFLETENIQRMSWPENSPDLNPIEYVWDMLARQIAALSYPPSSVTELKRALQEAWNRFSQQFIHHLIASMVNRCAACLAVRGDDTPY
ncbi:transposable element Tc3 transposase [Trichonephila clavipes]|nr:transposable element Tc3 transposase [Trichonephila clavipes]